MVMNGLRNDTALGANMNERIRELSKDADLDWHKHWNDDETNRLEKFAQLIVQECVIIVAGAVDHREPASTYVDKIKQHFGVEQ